MGEYNSDEVFAFLRIIEILSKVKGFRSWLQTYHGIQDHDEFFEGYKFMLTTCLRCLIEADLLNDPFKLKEDEILYRVNFMGKPLDDAPNSCEKIVFLKQILSIEKKIRKVKNYEKLAELDSLAELLSLYSRINKLYLYSNLKKYSKEKLLNCVAQFSSYIMLIDTSAGFPHGLKVSTDESVKSHNFMNMAFKGYVFALQFLWWQFLGEIKFKTSVLSRLHECYKIRFEDYEEESDFPEINFVEFEQPISKKELEERKQVKQVRKLWLSIDRFFNPVREEIIRPLEKELGYGLGRTSEGLLRLKGFRKSTLKKFITKKVQEPSWVSKNDIDSQIKQLDCIFRWYRVTISDIEQSYEYNGAFAFIFTLRGYIATLQKKNMSGKITVQMLKHPAAGVVGYNYSFAILISVGGLISDSSGWLVYHDVATDYSGTGGDLLEQCREVIEEESSNIELREFTVEQSVFRRFLKEKVHFLPKTADVSKLYESSETLISKNKAKLFEYLTFKWIFRTRKTDRVDCDIKINNQQMDCYSIHNDTVEIFECKLNLHEDYETIITDLHKKEDALRKEYPRFKFKYALAVLAPVHPERLKEFRKKEIAVYHNFLEIILREPAFRGAYREVSKVLRSNLKSKYDYHIYDDVDF